MELEKLLSKFKKRLDNMPPQIDTLTAEYAKSIYKEIIYDLENEIERQQLSEPVAKELFEVLSEYGSKLFCPHCQEDGIATILGGWENYCGWCGKPVKGFRK